MLTEPLPVAIFIDTCFERKNIKTMTDQWRVETDELKSIILSYYQEMGIYSVYPSLEHHIRREIPRLLQSSPEVLRRVAEAERRERMLSRSRRLSD